MRVQTAPGHETETITALLARGDVEFATLNYYVQAQSQPDDPEYGLQWGLAKIDASQAWDLNTGNDNIIIAVIDTGIDLDHPDLQAKIITGYDYVNDDPAPDDDNGHGTHVAGIAAAVTNNSLGVAGLNWGARIMPLKALNQTGNGSTFDVAQAVYYAVDHGAQIINLSVGASGSKWPCNWPEIEAAFNYAVSQGVLLVVASGNNGQDGVNCPGAYDQAMAVGSTTPTDERSFFSNYGPRLDITAPGSSIYSTVPDGYGYKNGTSMATPYVSGLAGLLWSFAPSLTAAQVREMIQSSAEDLGLTGWDEEFGHGRINALHALQAVSLQSSPPQLTFLVDDENGSAPVSDNIQVTSLLSETITWTVTISPNVSWLRLGSPASGVVSSTSDPAGITLLATHPVSYGVYTTTVVITGTISSGGKAGPAKTMVQIEYLSQLPRLYMPIILKP